MLVFQEILLVVFVSLLLVAILFKLLYSNTDLSLEDFDYDYEKYKEGIELAKLVEVFCTFAIIVLAILIFIDLFFIFINTRSENDDKEKSKKDEKEITCLGCGNIMSRRFAFCPRCGKSVGNNVFTHVYCEKCGEKNGIDSSFCRMCGALINKPKL